MSDPGTSSAALPAYRVGNQLRFEDSFVYLFKAHRGWATLLVGSLLMLFSFLIVPLLVLLGWGVAMGRAVARGEGTIPRFRLAMAGDGFKAAFIGIVYMLPMFVLYGVMGASGYMDESAAVQSGAEFAGFMFTMFLAMLYGLALSAVQPAVFAVYIADGKVGSCFSYRRIKQVFSSWRSTYIAAAAILLGVGSLAGVGFILLIVGMAATYFYYLAFYSHLCGQLARPVMQDQPASPVAAGPLYS